MNSIENDLLQALTELDNSVRTLRSARPKPNLAELFARIDVLASKLPAGTDPTFLHYLKKKSYQKARLYLEGRDTENVTGNCGHVN